MRPLRLASPLMSGTDVADWQRFLTSQGVFPAGVDGVFGPETAQATRDYQSKARLAIDGVVGPSTLARAISDGFKFSVIVNLPGMDARVDCSPFAPRIAAGGMKFVARYYSNFAAKTLTPLEARKLSDSGLQIVVVFEDANDIIGVFTAARGASDATTAVQLASAVGQPAGSAIYFAVDFDPAQAEVAGPIVEYFQAVNQVLNAAPVLYCAGVYGSGLTCRMIRDSGFAKFTWLSGSSAYRESSSFRAQADILQSAPSRSLFDRQLDIDDDVAQKEEFGAFRPGPTESA
jgi:hypothetical protein